MSRPLNNRVTVVIAVLLLVAVLAAGCTAATTNAQPPAPGGSHRGTAHAGLSNPHGAAHRGPDGPGGFDPDAHPPAVRLTDA